MALMVRLMHAVPHSTLVSYSSTDGTGGPPDACCAARHVSSLTRPQMALVVRMMHAVPHSTVVVVVWGFRAPQLLWLYGVHSTVVLLFGFIMVGEC